MAFARRTWLYTLGLWLSLAMVLGHALAPVGSPIAPKSGSAFSASTWDVSLGAVRGGLNAKLKRGQWSPDDEGNAGSAPLLASAAPAFTPPAPAAELAEFLPPAPPLPAQPRSGFDARAPPRA